MSFEAGSITTTLGLNISPYASGMMTATSIASIFPSTVTSFLANPLLGVIDICKQLTLSMAGAFTSSIDALDDIGDSAENLGVSVETLNSLQRVGQMSGISDMGESLKFLSKNAAEAAGGTGAMADTFRQAGISATDAAGNIRPVEDLLMDLSDTMAGTPIGERVALSMSMLGRSGGQMVGVLAQGSGALRQVMSDVNPLGNIVSTQAATAAGAFNKMVDTLKFAWIDMKGLLAQELMPGLKPMLAELLGYIRTHGADIRAAVRTTAMSVLNSAADLIDALHATSEAAKYIMPIIGGIWGATKGSGIGGAIGGLLGSVIPGVGTAAGAGVGSLVGGLIGGGAGAYGGYAVSQAAATAMDAVSGSAERLREAAKKVGQTIGQDVADNLQAGWKEGQHVREAQYQRAALEGW